jgi:peptidylprolyl isomerase
MRHALALAALLIAGCSGTAATPDASDESAWRSKPIADALEPSAVIEVAPAAAWRAVDPANLLVMELDDGSRIAIELAPDFAPIHVANIRALARGGWWNGATVYRVQDNYVVQWGRNEDNRPLPAGVIKAPPAEYARASDGLAIRPLGYPDSYAPAVGYSLGWPVGYDRQKKQAWLAHCYGMVGVGRDLAPDTGTGGELYAVIGHAPRHLDRNIALVGRVIDGFDALTARRRGTEALGFIKDEAQHIPITRIVLAADLPEAERPAYQVMRTESESFTQFVTGRANRGGDFFQVPAGGVDLCNALVPTRKVR